LFEALPVHGAEIEQRLGITVWDQILLRSNGVIQELLDATADSRGPRNALVSRQRFVALNQEVADDPASVDP
jgi:hypothetical protein